MTGLIDGPTQRAAVLKDSLPVVVAALAAGWLAARLGVPGAWRVGPLLAALVLGAGRGLRVHTPEPIERAALATIGVSLSQSFGAAPLGALGGQWPVLPAITAVTLALGLAGGQILARLSSIDRATATLGIVPGASFGMLAMSNDLGADARLVAVMQYLRKVLVMVSAALVSGFLLPIVHGHGPRVVARVLPAGGTGHWNAYLTALLVAVAGCWAAHRCRIPAGPLIGPLVLGALLAGTGVARAALPAGLAPLAYAVVGMEVGSLFDREALRRAGRLLPVVIGCVLALIAGCGLLGWLLTVVMGMDATTAYLATTPSGIDASAVTALGSGANVPVVVVAQTVRFLAMALLAPPLVRRLMRASGTAAEGGHPLRGRSMPTPGRPWRRSNCPASPTLSRSGHPQREAATA